MDNTLSKQARDWREGRRLRAWELKEEGHSQQQIATVLGVTKGAVSQWMDRGRQGGVEGLKRRVAPGASPRLSEGQQAELAELIASYDAEDFGVRGKVWTCGRAAAVIRWQFGVSYHPSHVSRLLRSLGLSRQKPTRRANQREEEAIERWKKERWPELKGGIEGGQDHPVCRPVRFLSVACGVAHLLYHRPYSDFEREAILRSPLGDERHHPGGKLLMMEQDRAFKGKDVVRFLKHALAQIPGKVLVVWDGSPIHHGGAVKDFLASEAADRLQLEQLPGYAPDLNPDEGIWSHLKCVELKNVCCRNLSELRVELRRAKERLRHKKHVILGCIRQPGFEV